jgi:hypothetical protein
MPTSQALTKPAVPEFIIQEIADPYDVPPTFTIDPYTGETITYPGYHVESKTTILKISNQPFTPYINYDSSKVNIYYQYRFKDHSSDSDPWTVIPSEQYSDNQHIQSASEYTIIPLKLYTSGSAIQSGDQFDIQVRAFIGISPNNDDITSSAIPIESQIKNNCISDWSTTQTLTIATSLTTPTPLPSAQIKPVSTVSPSNTNTLTLNQQITGVSSLFDSDQISLGIAGLFGGMIMLLTVIVVYMRGKNIP